MAAVRSQLDLFELGPSRPRSVAPIEPAMIARILRDPLAAAPHNPAARGYVVTYRDASTCCPGCGRNQWLVGRMLAECAFCSTAVPIAEAA